VKKFQGILPAVVTPLDSDGRFAQASFERLLEFVYGAGVHGVYVGGHTGEGMLQSAEQRKRLAAAAVQGSPPGKCVIIHVGAHRPEEALDLARHAARIGAHAVSSLPPSGPYSFQEIRRYYEALAAAGLPLFAYYFPELCPAVSTAEHLLELCAIPNLIGAKFTDFNLYVMAQLKKGGATVFNGRDEVLAAGLLMGADGGIGTFYNLVPELFVELYEAASAGDWDAARRTQRAINELIETVLRYPMLQATKAILRWFGIDSGNCLAPRRPLTPEEESELRDAIAGSVLASSRLAKRAGA
jgi:N-acetylneuraminate lyase